MSDNLFNTNKTEYSVLSLGAGVQSSALALMAAHGEITPAPDFAVFADTQAEPTEVYEWLESLKEMVANSPNPFPIITVTYGNLTEDSLKVRTSQGKGKRMKKGETYLRAIIPFFGEKDSGERTAAIGRSCTADYKIKAVHREIRKRCDIKHGQKEITVTQWIGISWDEIQRMKYSRVKWMQHRWPLLETRTTRQGCKDWMRDNGYPEPPRSACYYCPFHSDTEWRRLKTEDPVHFEKAVVFDKELRSKNREYNKRLRMETFLHNSCVPLEDIDFSSDVDRGQDLMGFMQECEGMCGI